MSAGITHSCQRRKDTIEHAGFAPANETVVKRLVRTVGRRSIAPHEAVLQHMNDPADYSAVIDAWDTARFVW